MNCALASERSNNRRKLYIVLVIFSVLSLTIPAIYLIQNPLVPVVPRHLEVGDSWTYAVIFPDGESYELTESVKNITELNGTLSYLFFRDDAQHVSTEYIWITHDWFEIKTYQPHIGNLLANSTVTYSPPVELYRVPLRMGEKWAVNSSVTTSTHLKNSQVRSVVRLIEERRVETNDQISISAGSFHAFKITAEVNGTLTEATWFDTSLGQIVRGEYYNGKEEVTQTLVAYSENNPTMSTNSFDLYAFVNLAWKHFASYIYNKPRLLTELKIPHD